MQIRAFKQPYRSAFISIFIDDFRGGRELYTAKPIEFIRVEKPLEEAHLPTLDIMPTEAQKLMDDLWDCGIRPSEGTGSAGQLAATQKHLDDMRKLVFAQPYQDIIVKLCNKMADSPSMKVIRDSNGKAL